MLAVTKGVRVQTAWVLSDCFGLFDGFGRFVGVVVVGYCFEIWRPDA